MPDVLDAIQDETFATLSKATRQAYPAERRLSPGVLGPYVDRRRYAVVGTTRPDGRPHAALTSYFRRDGSFWLPTVAGAARARNIASHPWATLTVYEGDGDEHVAVIVEGPARLVAPAEVPPDVSAEQTGDWVAAWIELEAARLMSYAEEGGAI